MYSLWKLTLWIHRKERCLGQNLGRNPGRRKRKNANIVVPRYNNVNGEFFVVACPVFDAYSTLDSKFLTKNSSSCLWKTLLFSWNWSTLKSRTWKYRANSLRAAIAFCFRSRSVDWMFGSLVAAKTFLLFRWLLPFYFTACFNRSFSPWFNCPFLLSQSLFDGVRLRLQKFPRIQWAIFVVGARVSEACVSLVGGMTQLTAALMRCDKLSKL